MTPEEEELEKKKRAISDILKESLKKMDEDIAAVEDFSKTMGTMHNALNQLSEINRKSFLKYRADYLKFFLYHINEKKDYRSQLAFVHEQVTDLTLKIGRSEEHTSELQSQR